MAITISAVVIADDTFEDWVIVTNAVCNALATQVLTANTTAGVTSGNTILVGMFQSNVFVVNTAFRGGNLSVDAAVELASNLNFNGFSLVGNSSGIVSIGADVSANSTVIKVPRLELGNTTVNTAINSISVVTRTATLNSVGANAATANNLTVNTGTFANITANNYTGNSYTGNTGVWANLTCNNFTANSVITNTAGITNATIENLQVNNMVVESITQGSNVSIGSAILMTEIVYDGLTTTMSTLDSWVKADFRATDYFLVSRIAGVNSHQCVKLMAIHDGGDAYLTEFGTISTNTDHILFQITTNTTHILLQANTTAAGNIKGVAMRIRP